MDDNTALYMELDKRQLAELLVEKERELQGIQQETSGLSPEVRGLHAKITQLQGELEGVRRSVRSTYGLIGAEIADFDGRLTGVEAHLGMTEAQPPPRFGSYDLSSL